MTTVDKITQIHFILDRSGSMYEILGDTIGGFNSFIQSQQNDQNGECFMNLYQFDHEYQIVYQNKPIKEVEMLTEKTFMPRGQTALLDAIGRTVSCVSVDTKETNNIVVILTDGYENSSIEFTYKKVTEIIEKKEKDGWKFVFLGANQDAIKTAGGLGINQNSAMTYAQTPKNVNACFRGLSDAISRTRSGENERVSFTENERLSSKE
jgi:hypothetical protein